MIIEKFLTTLEKNGWGIAAFNTYNVDDYFLFYLMVSQKGNTGRFLKREGDVNSLGIVFDDMINNIENDSDTFDCNNLSTDEVRTAFDNCLKTFSEDYMDQNNARFSIRSNSAGIFQMVIQ